MTRTPRTTPPRRQPLMPEGAANPARATSHHHGTEPIAFTLYEGHLGAECSLLYNGAPACPACLTRELAKVSPAR
jgi:hypothetical protein